MLQMGVDEVIVQYLTGAVDRIYEIISQSGVQILIFLAGIQSISPQLYEVAVIEGSSGYETFWKITFPMVSPLILVNVIYTIIDYFASNAMTDLIRETAFNTFNFGLSSAMAWVYFIIISIILVVCTYFISKGYFTRNNILIFSIKEVAALAKEKKQFSLKKGKKWLWPVVRAVLLIGLSFIILYPVFKKISMAVRAKSDLYSPIVVWIPQNFSLENFRYAIEMMDYWRTLLNTTVLCLLTTSLTLISCALAGYGFARLRFKEATCFCRCDIYHTGSAYNRFCSALFQLKGIHINGVNSFDNRESSKPDG